MMCVFLCQCYSFRKRCGSRFVCWYVELIKFSFGVVMFFVLIRILILMVWLLECLWCLIFGKQCICICFVLKFLMLVVRVWLLCRVSRWWFIMFLRIILLSCIVLRILIGMVFLNWVCCVIWKVKVLFMIIWWWQNCVLVDVF